MIEIRFSAALAAISVLWVLVRGFWAIKKGTIDWKYEAKLLTVYICIVVIVRFTFFAWHLQDGKIQPLVLDMGRLLPLNVNFIPIVHLFYHYEGWQRNLIGNIAMFIPVGIIWPWCFKKLDSFAKTVLAGFSFSLCIEVLQLLCFERNSDVDDLITNTLGVVIGAAIYFLVRFIHKRSSTSAKP